MTFYFLWNIFCIFSYVLIIIERQVCKKREVGVLVDRSGHACNGTRVVGCGLSWTLIGHCDNNGAVGGLYCFLSGTFCCCELVSWSGRTHTSLKKDTCKWLTFSLWESDVTKVTFWEVGPQCLGVWGLKVEQLQGAYGERDLEQELQSTVTTTDDPPGAGFGRAGAHHCFHWRSRVWR